MSEQFLTLARTPDPSAEQAARLAALKREMTQQVMAGPADAVYERLA